MTWPRWLSVLAAFLTAGAVFATCLLAWLDPTRQRGLLVVAAVVVGGVPVFSGLWVARHHPRSALGYLLVLPGLFAALAALVGTASSADPARVLAGDYLTAASQGAWVLIYVVISLPLLFFPRGRLESRAARVLLWLIVGDAAVFMVVAATAPGPFLPPDELSPHVFGSLPAPVADVSSAVALILLPMTLLALWAHVVRRQRASVGAQRRQFSWLALGAALLPMTLLASWLSYAMVGNADAVLLCGITLTYVAVPLVMATAVVRPDLFDPARLLATATVHMLVTTSLLVVFTGVTAVAGLFVVRGAPEIALAAAALCALGMARLRSRLQPTVDRWLYPARPAAFTAIAALQRDVLTGSAEPEEVQGRLRLALRDDTLTVEYRSVDGVGSRGDPARRGRPRVTCADVLMGSHVIGTIKTRAEVSAELLRDIAQRMAPLVELGRVRVDLRRALQDADDSRARLLRVSYEERAKLERDLHDGAQQRLVALGMALRLAQRHLSRGDDIGDVLDAAVTQLGTAVSELRQLAHGIRPSCLDDGLELALASLVASTPTPITVHVQTPELTTDVETTAYYVAAEAIANAVKHSGAGHIALDVSSREGQLHVKVVDDGAGTARATPGSGLAGLSDRVSAHGGQLVIASGNGTVVEAVLPCG